MITFDAKTLLQQLGGNMFVTMTGAKNLMQGENFLQFKIGRNSKRINSVRITLDENDTYTMEFGRIRKLEYTKVVEDAGIYCDQLQEIFTETTGMYTHL